MFVLKGASKNLSNENLADIWLAGEGNGRRRRDRCDAQGLLPTTLTTTCHSLLMGGLAFHLMLWVA